MKTTIRMTKLHGSSLVKAIGFSGNSYGTLTIKFDDCTIDFGGVARQTYTKFLNSDDPGKFYQDNIHGQYEYIKR